MAPASAAVVAPRSATPAFLAVGSAPRIPYGARQIGTVTASSTETGAVVLTPRDSAGLTRFIAEATNKESASYRDYLPAGAFEQRFGPTVATIDAVRSVLTADGLRVTGVTSRRPPCDLQRFRKRVSGVLSTPALPATGSPTARWAKRPRPPSKSPRPSPTVSRPSSGSTTSCSHSLPARPPAAHRQEPVPAGEVAATLHAPGGIARRLLGSVRGRAGVRRPHRRPDGQFLRGLRLVWSR